MINPPTTNYPPDLTTTATNELKWCYVLSDFFYTLPPDSIDLKDTTSLEYDDKKQLIKGCDSKTDDGIYVPPIAANPITITLTFGKNQSGRQGKVTFLTKDDYSNIESGEVDTSTITTDITAKYKYYGILPKICGGNGGCDNSKGICNCYNDYTGFSCEVKPLSED